MGMWRVLSCRPCFCSPAPPAYVANGTPDSGWESFTAPPLRDSIQGVPSVGRRSEWREGDEIEYLLKDVGAEGKIVRWVQAEVVSVRTRLVRGQTRLEYRIAYSTNSKDRETTYWQPHCNLRIRLRK